MTRIDKYQPVRNQITKDIQENALIWEQEKKIEQYENQLLKLNKEYFAPIIKNVNDHLKLLNLDNIAAKNNFEYLETKDKYLLIKILSDINNVFESYQPNSESYERDKEKLVDYPLEYATLIESMNQKIVEFEKNLESKMSSINAFVKSLEKKYQKDNNSQEFEKSIKEIKINNNKLQDDFQQLKVKGKNSYKISFVFFATIIVSLVLIVVLLVLLVMLK
ncbi:hypothetical protein [Spiroplasma platyhelix]|uniref:Transmembrane protein n=1 Tax=Spiroplasma platyhelix PALS-1 TaxID=1276218 RepID=A0A846TZW1_9MOLU|nr:hypothetical protein [Spiroplasma platyhelix]MBE4703941.1 hypothetical protein [Spiroplasma platyhelix PALS-1]NKE38314.1 hypothetical protein [Spiroplasma platyhelix PALS-1]UJB29199.1 hypothetical protein SPLAT_v1c04350 [Spiroplasma platyhelix PALS-1]